jgi:hypothetical protein
MSAASDASSPDAGTGQTWFKIYEDAPYVSGGALVFPSTTASTITFTIPSSVPSGQYLVRVEQIALHSASSFGGAQFVFMIVCGRRRLTTIRAGSTSRARS